MNSSSCCDYVVETFSKDEFVKQYRLLSDSCSSKAAKEEANLYTLRFQANDAVWAVARELILQYPNSDLQLLGAQILRQKLKTKHSVLSEGQKLELRQFFFQILDLFCAQQQKVSKLAKKQIVLSVSILGFTGIHLDWQNFVEDICDFIRQGEEHQIMIGLEILENVGSVESMDKVVPDMKMFQRLRSLFQSQMPSLSVIFNELLIHTNSNIGLATLSCLESWAGSQFKYQVLLDEGLTRNLLLLMRTRDENLFEKVSRILLEAIRNSNNAEILQTANVAASLSLMRPEEVHGLKVLIDELGDRAAEFTAQKQGKLSKLFAELVTEISLKFTILLLENSSHSHKLIELVLLCTQHQNLFISQQSFEFWVSFYRTLKNFVAPTSTNEGDISSQDWLISPYALVFRTVIEKCKYKKLDDPEKQKKKNQTITATAMNANEPCSIQLTKKYSLFPVSSSLTSKRESESTKDLCFAIDDDFIFGKDSSTLPYLLLDQDDDDDFGEIDMQRGNDDGDCSGYYDDDDDDSEEKNGLDFSDFERTSIKEYRIFAKDVINTVFNVVDLYRGDQGARQLLQMLYSMLNKDQFLQSNQLLQNDPAVLAAEYVKSVEVCLFAVQSMADTIGSVSSGGDSGYCEFISFIVNCSDFPSHKKTVGMAMQLFYDAQTELMKSQQLFDATIRFIFKYLLDDSIGLMAAQTFSGIIKGLGLNDAIDTFKFVANFFVINIQTIKRDEVLDELIQGVFSFALNLRQPAHQLETIQSLLQVVQQLIDQSKRMLEDFLINGGSGQQNLLLPRTLKMISSLLSGFSMESLSLNVDQSIADFIQENFKFLTYSFDYLMQTAAEGKAVAKNGVADKTHQNMFIDIFRSICKINEQRRVKAQKYQDESQQIQAEQLLIFPNYLEFLNTSISILQRDPVRFCDVTAIMKIILDLTKSSSSHHSQFLRWLEEHFNGFNYFFLNFFATHRQDPDLIMHFFEIQLRVLRYFPGFFLSSASAAALTEFAFTTAVKIAQYEMTRSILNFFYEFIKFAVIHIPSEAQKVAISVLGVVVEILPNVSSNLLHNIALVIVKLVESFGENTAEQLKAIIVNAFSTTDGKHHYEQFSEAQKGVLAECFVHFSENCKSIVPLQSLLIDLHQVLKDILPSNELFLNYEMKLRASKGDAIAKSKTPYNKQFQLTATLVARQKPAQTAADLDDLFN